MDSAQCSPFFVDVRNSWQGLAGICLGASDERHRRGDGSQLSGYPLEHGLSAEPQLRLVLTHSSRGAANQNEPLDIEHERQPDLMLLLSIELGYIPFTALPGHAHKYYENH